MRRLAFLVACACVAGGLAVSGTATTPGAGGAPAAASFRLLDGSAGCSYSRGSIACSSLGARHAVALARNGDSRVRRTPVTWTDETPVVRPSESWWHGGFSCRARGGALTCSVARGGAITVTAGGRIGGVAPPARFP